jgi:ubiquinone/menaquinone biosynthesis C-methylase UbiE
MKTEWDYTNLADAYLERPDYSQPAIDSMLTLANVNAPDSVCDVGAGVAHLTLMLAAKGLAVTAVEPNDAMRANGIKRTSDLANVEWFEGTGEQTGQASDAFELVTFGSSFNVCDRQLALKETVRLLKPNGYFACMWNHRDLSDPIQAEIESIIRRFIPDYGYGVRREDQRAEIDKSGLFGPVIHLDAPVQHEQSVTACVEAWRSHATLERQAGEQFHAIVAAIEDYVMGLGQDTICIPYHTHIWLAQRI